MLLNNIKITDKIFNKISPSKFIKFNITCPQIEGSSNKDIEKKINDFFKEQFLTGFEKIFGEKINILKEEDLKKCDSIFNGLTGKGKYLTIDIKYQLKLNKNGILSIYYDGLSILGGSAHPTKLYNGFTLNTLTGRVYTFKDLFKINVKYTDKINSIIQNTIKNKYKIENFSKKDVYDFYLTEKKLVIINIFDNFAYEDIEVEIDLTQIKDILSPDGPAL